MNKHIKEAFFFFFLLSFFFFSPKTIFSSNNVVINEFLANPVSGDKEWVELYNPTGSDINLTDWKLVDVANNVKLLNNLGVLPSNGFLVFETGEGWLNNTSTETIQLINNNGSIVDTYSYSIKQEENVTTGRSPDGSDTWGILQSGTKGSANSAFPPTPTLTPTFTPVPTQTPSPTSLPTKTPTPTPTVKPSVTPTTKPTSSPSPTAKPTATLAPTNKPTITATPTPTQVNKKITDKEEDEENNTSESADFLESVLAESISITPKPTPTVVVKDIQKKNQFLPFIFILGSLCLFTACGILGFKIYKGKYNV